MGTIADVISAAWRDYVTDGVPASGAHEPVKSEIRDIGPVIESAISAVGLSGLADVAYATRAELDADLDHVADSRGLVYADATDANNDLYVKVGASGAGSWTLTTIIHDIIGGLAQPYVDLAEAWAEGTEPGGPGTKSAMEHAADAEVFADEADDAVELALDDFEFFGPEAGYTVDGYDFVCEQECADGKSYILFGRKTDGTWEPGPEGAAGQGNNLYHVQVAGQSNGAGDGAVPPISTSATGSGNKRFAGGVNTLDPTYAANPEDRPDGDFELVDLIESAKETRATGMADTLKALIAGRGRFSAPVSGGDVVLVSDTSQGSRRLADIGPINALGEGQFIAMIDDIARAKAAAEAAGYNYVLLGCVVDQGEKEIDLKLTDAGVALAVSAFVTGYQAEAVQFAETYDTLARGVTGQTQPIPTFAMPAASHTYTCEGWVRAAEETPLIRLVGARGPFQSALFGNLGNKAQSIHYSPDSQRTDIGERCAWAIFNTCFRGIDHRPTVPYRAVKLDATHVRFDFRTNWPLVVDVDAIPPATDFGFIIRSGTIDAPGGAVLATAIEISEDGRSVTATFPSVPAGAIAYLANNGLTALAPAAVSSVGVASNDPVDAAARYSVTVVGNLSAELASLEALGHFVLYGATVGVATAEGVIREVTVGGGNTTFIGRNDELRTGGAYGAFAPGNTLLIGHTSVYGNVRNDDPALARTAYTGAPRVGVYPNLASWMVGRVALDVEGA
jgi:hypothetical protein